MEKIKEKTVFQESIKKIETKQAKIAVIGLGYVGLPHAIHYASSNFSVMGVDISNQKINMLKEGYSYIDDVEDEEVTNFILNNMVTTTFERIGEYDVIVIDVPTPLDKNMQPYMVHLEDALLEVMKYVRQGQLLILESTTFPTTTKEYIITPLEKRGWKIGEDIFVVYSPERIDPGNKKYSIQNTPKLVGGYTKRCGQLGSAFFGENAIPVSSPEVAELSKLYENTFRFVNIALSNELQLICEQLNLDTNEVLNAAETKPFGFMRFDPAVKIGGHCIGVDPYYLQWYMKRHQLETTMINAASQLDRQMIPFTVKRIFTLLNENRVSIFESSIAILGVTYKKNISDTRLSAAPDLARLLEVQGANVTLIDPLTSQCDSIDVIDINYHELEKFDLVVLLTNHDCLDYEKIQKESNLFMDARIK